MKKLLVLAALIAAGYFFLKKELDLEDATPQEMVDVLKDKISAPIEDAKESAAALEKSQAERINKAAVE